MRAFTGINKDGNDNTCGNIALNKTAKENINIFMPDIVTNTNVNQMFNTCAVHGGVHRTWSKLISTNKLALNNLELDKTGVSGFTRTDYFKSGEGMQASIFSSGLDANNPTVESITVNQGGTINQYGRDNQVNQFYNFNNSSAITSNTKTINIQNFESEDKVNLHLNSRDSTGKVLSHSVYRTNGNTILRKVCTIDSDCIAFYTSTPEHVGIVINGPGSSSVTSQELDKAKTNSSTVITFRNN